MYSVFSQSLIDRWNLYNKTQNQQNVPRDSEIKLKDILKWHIDNNMLEYVPQILYVHRITTLDYIAEDALYVICTTPEVRKIVTWICKNILMSITIDKYKTIQVKTRIAIDMLNKLEYQGVIDKELNLFYFDNVVSNIQDLFWELSAEDLPF